jgi:uncharacterized membrane protein
MCRCSVVQQTLVIVVMTICFGPTSFFTTIFWSLPNATYLVRPSGTFLVNLSSWITTIIIIIIFYFQFLEPSISGGEGVDFRRCLRAPTAGASPCLLRVFVKTPRLNSGNESKIGNPVHIQSTKSSIQGDKTCPRRLGRSHSRILPSGSGVVMCWRQFTADALFGLLVAPCNNTASFRTGNPTPRQSRRRRFCVGKERRDERSKAAYSCFRHQNKVIIPVTFLFADMNVMVSNWRQIK